MVKPIFIPFNRPCLEGNELRYIKEAIAKGHISGDGFYTKKCSEVLEEILNVPRALLTTSCTHSLEMAGLLLDLQPGDEVIVPAFTFVSTVNAFVLHGARPVFVDIRPDTLNLDEKQIESRITKHTKAVIPVHYAGVGCEMDTLVDIANRHKVSVIEDNAHGLFGKYNKKNLGTFGSFATLSFHETKNIICGEGGALIINDPQYVERAEIIREKGTDRSRFFRGEVDKYTWIDIGSSYLPSEILAAFLYAQLESRKKIQAKRKKLWDFYFAHLSGWAQDNDVRLPHVPDYCEQPYHMFYMILPSLKQRQALISQLKKKGIISVFHYLPLHLSTVGRKYGGREGDCPVTEEISDRLLRLPFYNELTESDQSLIIDSILNFK